MVQVLPAVPSFGEKLAGALENAGVNIAQGYENRQKQAKTMEALKTINDPLSTPTQKGSALALLDPKIAHSIATAMAPTWQAQQEHIQQKELLNSLFPNSSMTDQTNQETPQPRSENIVNNSPIDNQQNVNQNIQQPQVNPKINLKDPASWDRDTALKLSGLKGMKGELGVVGNQAKSRLDQIETEKKQFAEERKFHTEANKDFMERVSGLRHSLPRKELALQMARDAINSKEIGAFSLNNLAERTGIRELGTASGSQLRQAAKENLFNHISRISAKGQNQWLEKQISEAFPQIGRSEESNLMTEIILNSELEMDKNFIQTFEKLEQEDLKNYGFVKNDIEARTYQITESLDRKIMDKTSYLTREIYEKERGSKWVLDEVGKKPIKGTPLTIKMAKDFMHKYGTIEKGYDMAKKLGYKIPTQEDMKLFLNREE